MKIKMLVVVIMLAFSLLVTPLVLARPGAEKNNDKFQYFELIVSGTGAGIFEKEVISPPEGAPPNSIHRRGAEWDETSVDFVELTVGDEIFSMDTDPYSLDYITSFDIDILLDAEGNPRQYNIRLTDVVTVFDEDVEIGTLVLKITSVVEFTDGAPSGYSGTINGFGTKALKGVHISAEDLGLVNPDPLRYARIGTITGWPAEITND